MEEECKHGMTPAFCADCKGLIEEVPNPFEGLLVERFYLSAQHQQTCAMSRRGLQHHEIGFGSRFALAVHDNDGGTAFKRFGYVCEECTDRIASGG